MHVCYPCSCCMMKHLLSGHDIFFPIHATFLIEFAQMCKRSVSDFNWITIVSLPARKKACKINCHFFWKFILSEGFFNRNWKKLSDSAWYFGNVYYSLSIFIPVQIILALIWKFPLVYLHPAQCMETKVLTEHFNFGWKHSTTITKMCLSSCRVHCCH